ncbi:TonB-dependent receptor [Aestuariibacter halophilus]|uniref:TonB-dependent receptor n=1 Tax=Fluctibacter halophilus TaxID=226011 RepID=A0ABS8GB85_9ALTE|nr:TonB-dependent receptor [Aestuariibacter halophilus]MCC2617773.1 TonB-dependent receptor [Aestuariibacter halophilus]
MNNTLLPRKSVLSLAIVGALSSPVMAQEAPSEEGAMDEIIVIGRSVSYANNATDEAMIKQQSSMTSALAVIDNLPGVLINEGDTFGTDDWSTSISIRGFQTNLDEQQIGMTVDGISNGNSNYGGGAKANRYIDTENLRNVEVSQGTSDISSRSNEALGGTLNFTTIEPGTEQQMIVSATIGDFQAQKLYARFETGELAENTYAWISASSMENTDWINGAAENTRTHLAAKLTSMIGDLDLTAYLSYDDVHEDNYQRIYGLAQYAENPEWDGLTADWTGIPYQDQAYRKGWSTLRENLFGYLQATYQLGEVMLKGNVYFHDNEGRGDWVPPYVVDVINDGAGNPQTEVLSNEPIRGGSAIGQIYFVDANGVQLAPIEGCQSSISFPYGGAGPEYDPGCYAQGAIPVGSYRNSHYNKSRVGFNGDFEWMTFVGDMENTLRGGIWYENYQREEYRDWHKIIDSATSYEFDHVPYWIQYSREYPVDTTMLYLEDTLRVGPATLRAGVKKFMVELERNDKFGETPSVTVDSDSDLLFTAGAVVETPIDGLEVFAGYAENFAAIKDEVLERDASSLANIDPETADNIDVGLRYSSDNLQLNLTYYDITFENRLTFIAPDSDSGIDYLVGTNGVFRNVGGVESKGIEASLSYFLTDDLTVFASYTNNDSTYTGSTITDEDGDAIEVGFPKGNTVLGSAEDMFVVTFDWQRDNYFAGLSSKYVGERYIDGANSAKVDAYTVSDFYAGATVDMSASSGLQSLEFRLTINNLFDENYLGTISNGAGWLGAPRTAALNVKATF